MTVDLAFPDQQYPDVKRAQYETTVEADGAGIGGGCSTTGTPANGASAAFLAGLVGLALAFRRRK